VLIATRPVDFRRGADSLAAMVQLVLGQDPDQEFYENYACGAPRNYSGYCGRKTPGSTGKGTGGVHRAALTTEADQE